MCKNIQELIFFYKKITIILTSPIMFFVPTNLSTIFKWNVKRNKKTENILFYFMLASHSYLIFPNILTFKWLCVCSASSSCNTDFYKNRLHMTYTNQQLPRWQFKSEIWFLALISDEDIDILSLKICLF